MNRVHHPEHARSHRLCHPYRPDLRFARKTWAPRQKTAPMQRPIGAKRVDAHPEGIRVGTCSVNPLQGGRWAKARSFLGRGTPNKNNKVWEAPRCGSDTAQQKMAP